MAAVCKNKLVEFFFIFIDSFYYIENNQCLNVYCSSCASFKYDRKTFENANNAAAEAIKITHDYGCTYLDEYINSNLFLREDILQQIINRCKEINNWQLLQNLMFSVFSNRQNLSSSFLQKGFPLYISLNNETSPSASATAKSTKQFLYVLCNKFNFISF